MAASRDDLWAVTAYSNFSRNPYRLQNFHVFRERLSIPLVTVEISDGDFQLDSSCAEILVQVHATRGLWQTERAFNIGLAHLPVPCRKVAWIDSDIIVERGDWACATSALLEEIPLVQPFSELHETTYRPVGARPAIKSAALSALSVPAAVSRGYEIEQVLRQDVRDTGRNLAVTGAVWAAGRDFIMQHGVYDACLLAGNDRALACAAYGYFEIAKENWHMSGKQFKHYLSWAERFYDGIRGRVGYLSGKIVHLWHGDPMQRQRIPRYEALQCFDFDPYTDLARSHSNCWSWSTTKAGLREFVDDYFNERERVGLMQASDLRNRAP